MIIIGNHHLTTACNYKCGSEAMHNRIVFSLNCPCLIFFFVFLFLFPVRIVNSAGETPKDVARRFGRLGCLAILGGDSGKHFSR